MQKSRYLKTLSIFNMSNTHFNLQSLLEAIDKIDIYSQTFKTADDFHHDSKSFDASMMQFVVIGEIVTRLDEGYKQTHSTIPWQKVKNFRNIIAHDYFGIDADEIWSIIQNHLIPLRTDIKALLEEC
ncbi:MAG: Unknown protein [uncultured Sulfurovum sp.]|uniref:DUF86 domain-containing protein n=1 Tax=uncultured Sulfurovum sp. TaxID=269237 RepID=A0A6S6UA12_9BACT|nr:MAG: Unknown protein [uncultured Sulfurovum sp.]